MDTSTTSPGHSAFIYGLEYQARALCAQGTSSSSSADPDSVRFIVGTQSLKNKNQVHLLDYSEESPSRKAIIRHEAGEIWDLSAHPKHPNLLASSYSSKSGHLNGKSFLQATLWKYPIDVAGNLSDGDGEEEAPLSDELVKVLDLSRSGESGTGRTINWDPEEGNKVVSEQDNRLLLWDIPSTSLISSHPFDMGEGSKASSKFSKMTTLRWSPHYNCSIIGLAIGSSVCGTDIRVPPGPSGRTKNIWNISGHSQLVRDLDFNPNNQHFLATCGG